MTCSRKCFFACPAKLNRETNVCSFMQGISFWQSLICPFFLANQKVHLHYLLILSENNNQSLSQVLIFGKNLELGLLSSNMNPSKRQNGMFGQNVQTILSRFCLEERGRNVCKQSRIQVCYWKKLWNGNLLYLISIVGTSAGPPTQIKLPWWQA